MATTGKADSRIIIRRVTYIHSNWSEQGDLKDGKFLFQLILDNGAQEQVVLTTARDTKALTKLFGNSDSVYFDSEREALVFGCWTVPFLIIVCSRRTIRASLIEAYGSP